jgi:hypothetical protein
MEIPYQKTNGMTEGMPTQGDSVSSDLRNDGGVIYGMTGCMPTQGDSVSSDLRNDGGVIYGMTEWIPPWRFRIKRPTE